MAMNISELTDQEKSVVLARLMGWECTPFGQIILPVPEEFDWFDISIQAPNIANDTLYDQQNMALAWRVLNWASTDQVNSTLLWDQYQQFEEFWEDSGMWHLPPADAQRRWLDKILEIAIEAGLVDD
jgi:hypothetical protein